MLGRDFTRREKEEEDDWTTGGVSELKRRGEARRGEAQRWEKELGAKNAECSECVSQLSFPSSLPSFLPSRPVIRLPDFPSTVFLSSSCLVRRPRPPSDRLVLIRASEGEGPLVAKKLGYFATFHVDKLRLAQSVLGWREAGGRPARQARNTCSSRLHFLPISFSLPLLSSPLLSHC